MSATSPKHVLAIDDDALILRYLRIALERAGYRSSTIDDPEKVVPCIKNDPPDLILLDIRLPGTDGFSLFVTLREATSCPVIFLSAGNRSDDRERALNLGASAFIVKPFAPPELLNATRKVLTS